MIIEENQSILNEIKNILNEMNCELVSTKYKNANTKLEYICICGNHAHSTTTKIREYKRCRCCMGMRKDTKNDLEYIRREFEKFKFKLITTVFNNIDDILEFKCKCGNINYTTWRKFREGYTCEYCNFTSYGSVSKINRLVLINEFFRYFDENGVYPTTENLKFKHGYPSYTYYRNEWGSWDNFLKNIGVVNKETNDGWYAYDEQVLHDMYSLKTKEEIINSLMIKRKWEVIIKKANELGLKRDYYVGRGIEKPTKENLIKQFWDFYKEHNKYPMSDDFKQSSKYFTLSTITRYFDSWLDYLKEVGVVSKDNMDGWYIHDEDVLREHYPRYEFDTIIEKLMIKREIGTIKTKASEMCLKVLNEFRYIPKHQNEETRNKLIIEAQEFYLENGRSPYSFELSLPRNAVYQNWNSYNDFLEECELPIFRRIVEISTKEEGIKFLQDLHRELNRNPIINDLDKYGMNKSWFTNMYGSYTNALFESGLISELDADKELKLEHSIRKYRDYYIKTNEVLDYTKSCELAKENNLFHANTLMDKLGISSYHELCKYLYGETNREEYDKDELINSLIKLNETLGRPPMAKELTEYGLHSFCVYKTFFKVRYFNDIIKELGWEPYGHDPQYKTDEELLEDYKNLFEKLNRLPSIDEINNEDSMCSHVTYLSRFDTFKNVCDLLDIDYNNYIIESRTGSSKIFIDKKGELCRSFPEMYITNLLIDNNIEYIKEYHYSELNNKITNKTRMDWYLSDYDMAVEYFGLFREESVNDDSFIGKYTRKTYDKIQMCKENNIDIIDLYPNDKLNDFEGVKRKLNKYITNSQFA